MYQVIWMEAAVLRLANAWAQADSPRRAEITAAANRIDEMLSRDPQNAGESRSGHRRIVIDDPMAVVYGVDESGNMVVVQDVNVRKHLK